MAQVCLKSSTDAITKTRLNNATTSGSQGKTETQSFMRNLWNLYFKSQLNKTKLYAGQRRLKPKSTGSLGLAPE